MGLISFLKKLLEGDVEEIQEVKETYIGTIGRKSSLLLEQIESATTDKSGDELKEGIRKSLRNVEEILDLLRSTRPDPGYFRAHYNYVKAMECFEDWLTSWMNNDLSKMEKIKMKLNDLIDKVNRDYKGRINLYLSIRSNPPNV